jgi:hypothetical protein
MAELLCDVKGMGYNLLSRKDCVITLKFHSATAGRESRPTAYALSSLPFGFLYKTHTQRFWLWKLIESLLPTRKETQTRLFLLTIPEINMRAILCYHLSFPEFLTSFFLSSSCPVMYSIYTFLSFVILFVSPVFCLVCWHRNLNKWHTQSKDIFLHTFSSSCR